MKLDFTLTVDRKMLKKVKKLRKRLVKIDRFDSTFLDGLIDWLQHGNRLTEKQLNAFNNVERAFLWMKVCGIGWVRNRSKKKCEIAEGMFLDGFTGNDDGFPF